MVKNSSSFGISGFVLSLLGLIFFIMPYFAIIFSILAIIFSIKQNKRQKNGLSTAGFAMGIIGTVINAIILIIILFWIILS